MSRIEDALKRLACVLGCVESEEQVNGNTVDEIIDCICEHLPSGGGGLPVVELTTILADGVTLNAEESAAFTAASASQLPIILKGTISLEGMEAPFGMLAEYVIGQYGIAFNGMTIDFEYLNDCWNVQFHMPTTE